MQKSLILVLFVMASRGHLLCFQTEINSILSLKDKNPSASLICGLDEHFSDEFVSSGRVHYGPHHHHCIEKLLQNQTDWFLSQTHAAHRGIKNTTSLSNTDCIHLLYTVHASDTFSLLERLWLVHQSITCIVLTWA